jgi:hypothetical protein
VIRNNKMKIQTQNVHDEISKIREIAKVEKVSMSFVLNVKNLLEVRKHNQLFSDANVLVDGYPSALEKIAINTEKI